MAFSGYSTPVHLGEICQNVLAHGVRSTTPFDVGRVQVASMTSWKRSNCISMKKGLSTSTCGALTAPMSGHPKMLPERVKKHSGESSAWSFTWRFWQQNSRFTDGNGLPLGFCLSPGQSAEIRYATSALAMARIPTGLTPSLPTSPCPVPTTLCPTTTYCAAGVAATQLAFSH